MEENEGRLLLLVLRAVRAALAQAQVVPVAVRAALVNAHLAVSRFLVGRCNAVQELHIASLLQAPLHVVDVTAGEH